MVNLFVLDCLTVSKDLLHKSKVKRVRNTMHRNRSKQKFTFQEDIGLLV